MQGAYLVQLGTEAREELSGRVEEVDTGRATRFHSGAELLQFLTKHIKAKTELEFAGHEKDQ
jgi:hypothetical protein